MSWDWQLWERALYAFAVVAVILAFASILGRHLARRRRELRELDEFWARHRKEGDR